jgi:hypothetical protein
VRDERHYKLERRATELDFFFAVPKRTLRQQFSVNQSKKSMI